MKRNDRRIPIRAMADMVEFSVEFYCDVEAGYRKPPNSDGLEKLADVLQLSGCDEKLLYKLAENKSGQLLAIPKNEDEGELERFEEFSVSASAPTLGSVLNFDSEFDLSSFIQTNNLKHIVLRLNRGL